MNEASTPLLDELVAIRAYIDAAREVLKDGHLPDIAVMEQRIANVCQGIQVAAVEEQSRCLPALAALLKNLDECEHDLRAWNDAQRKAVAADG